MKKLFLFAGIVAVLALIPLSSLMATQDEAPATTDQIVLVSLDVAPVVDNLVAICHFRRHTGDAVITDDGCGCLASPGRVAGRQGHRKKSGSDHRHRHRCFLSADVPSDKYR